MRIAVAQRRQGQVAQAQVRREIATGRERAGVEGLNRIDPGV